MTVMRPALRVLVATAIAVAVGACASDTGLRHAARFADVANLNDPRTIVDATIDGDRVTLRQGESLVVRLPVDAGDVSGWQIASLGTNPPVAAIRLDYMPASGPAMLPPAPPYSGWLARYNPPNDAARPADAPAGAAAASYVDHGEAVLRLRGIAPGMVTVQLDYRPLGDPAATPARTVRFDVEVVAGSR
jgi:hypothetical protein